jgi:hypothetical protein
LFAVFWQAIPAAGGKVKSIGADRRRLWQHTVIATPATRNKPEETSPNKQA